MRFGFRGVAVVTALVACTATAAAADPIEASTTLTVNALTGKHQVTGGEIDRLSFAPLPLAEITLKRRNDSIRIEGLPPVTFSYNSAGDGAQFTRLSIVNATYRRTFAGGWFAGIGQTLYNQSTTYRSVSGQYVYSRGTLVEPIYGSQVQFSRVTGLRVEAGRIAKIGPDTLEFWLAANPHMRGVQYTQIPGFRAVCPTGLCFPFVDTFADPENASQIDATVRVAHHVGKHGALLYGLRYLNYIAHYDDFPGQLADHNVGWAPVLGYRLRL